MKRISILTNGKNEYVIEYYFHIKNYLGINF